MKHPRDRVGRFVEAINSATDVELPGGTSVSKIGNGFIVRGEGQTKLFRNAEGAAKSALELSATSAHSHSLGYRAFRSYRHFADHEKRLRKYFKHKQTPEEWRAKMRDRGLIEARSILRNFKFDTKLHPHDRLGRFRETLDALPKPKRLGGGGEGVDIQDTPFKVDRTRRGFDVHHETKGTRSFSSADEAAQHVHDTVSADENIRAARAELAQSQQETLRQRLVREEQKKESFAAEQDRRYPRDPETGERYYYRLEKDPAAAMKIVESGELWGRPPRNYIQSDTPTAQAHKGRLDMGKIPEGYYYVEFTVDKRADPSGRGGNRGVTPKYGEWSTKSLGEDAREAIDAGLLRDEDGWAKLKINIKGSSLDSPARA